MIGAENQDQATKLYRSIHSNVFTQFIAEWLVLEWLETIATCALGLHDTKLKIDMDCDTANSDESQSEAVLPPSCSAH